MFCKEIKSFRRNTRGRISLPCALCDHLLGFHSSIIQEFLCFELCWCFVDFFDRPDDRSAVLQRMEDQPKQYSTRNINTYKGQGLSTNVYVCIRTEDMRGRTKVERLRGFIYARTPPLSRLHCCHRYCHVFRLDVLDFPYMSTI